MLPFLVISFMKFTSEGADQSVKEKFQLYTTSTALYQANYHVYIDI